MLRSLKKLEGYIVLTPEGEIGKTDDFYFDSENRWLPGKTVLIDPKWIEEFDRRKKRVGVSLTSEEIKNSPEYEPSRPVNRKYEERLYDYYGRPKYR